MLRGLCTINYYAADLTAAKQWYSDLLGVEPYYQRPGYIEFRIGDYQAELGIIDRQYYHGGPDAPNKPAGAITFWHVDDINATLERITGLGGTVYIPPRDFGNNFIVAAALDPFGNIVGVMENPHYLAMVNATATGQDH